MSDQSLKILSSTGHNELGDATSERQKPGQVSEIKVKSNLSTIYKAFNVQKFNSFSQILVIYF